jgi:predicted Holliday junction resolvase-like endonuclease
MEEKKNKGIEAEESTQADNGNNRNLITVLITLIILVVVVVIYWDRQNKRDFQQAQAAMQTDLAEEWGPLSQQQIQSALRVTPAAFSKQVSYKNIVARVAPSVVSVKIRATRQSSLNR